MRLSLIGDASNNEVISNAIPKAEKIIFDRVFDSLKKLGRDALKFAVSSPDREWQDYTGDLQESLGFGIFLHGKLVFWETLQEKQYNWAFGYQAVSDHNPPTGASAALGLINSKSNMFDSGIRMVIVAGMNYAMNVENIHLHKVLTLSLQFTEENWREYFIVV